MLNTKFKSLFPQNQPAFAMRLNVPNGEKLWIRSIRLLVRTKVGFLYLRLIHTKLLVANGCIRLNLNPMETLKAIRHVLWLVVMIKLMV